MSMLDRAREKTRDFFTEQPDTSLKDALIVILSRLKSDISGELLLKMTKAIILKWEELSKQAQSVEHELEAV